MKMSPTAERVQVLDVLRGVAIFGMFTVNMTADIWWSDQYEQAPLAVQDSLSLILVSLFTNGKFVTIFSLLFGAGLPRALARSQKQGKGPRLSQTKFMTMKPFTLPLFKDGRVVEHFTLMVSLELADAERRSELFHLTPKLRDAMYRTLFE